MTSEPNTNLPQSPDDPRDSLAAFAVGASDKEERLAVERLIEENPALRSEAAEYAAAADLLLGSVNRVAPPSALKDKIMAAARESRPQAAPPTPLLMPETPKTSNAARGIAVWIAAAAALALFALNVVWLTQLNQTRGTQQALSTADANYDKVVALLSAPDMQRTALLDTSGEGDPRAMIVWTPAHHEALMVTHSLPALGGDQSYQLWVIGTEGALSAGVFETDADGSISMMFETPLEWANVAAMGISVEPKGGSDQPTTDPLALATM